MQAERKLPGRYSGFGLNRRTKRYVEIVLDSGVLVFDYFYPFIQFRLVQTLDGRYVLNMLQ